MRQAPDRLKAELRTTAPLTRHKASPGWLAQYGSTCVAAAQCNPPARSVASAPRRAASWKGKKGRPTFRGSVGVKRRTDPARVRIVLVDVNETNGQVHAAPPPAAVSEN